MSALSRTPYGKEAPLLSDTYFHAITTAVLTAVDGGFSFVEQDSCEVLHMRAEVMETVQQGFLILLKKELASLGKTAAFDTHVTHIAVIFLEATLGITARSPDALSTVEDFLRVTIPNYEVFLVQTAYHIRCAFLTTWQRRYGA